MRSAGAMFIWLLAGLVCAAQDKPVTASSADAPRVFVTESQSWSVAGSGGGAGGAYGSSTAGGARPQTAEIIKTFGERCPSVKINNIQQKADYVVVLDHEGGKSVLAHRNKVAVFNRVTGDSLFSKSTLSLGSSVQDACEAIRKDWAEHGASMRQATEPAPAQEKPAAAVAAAAPEAAKPTTARMTVSSEPANADIEVDGSFVGSTPSEIQVPEGEHTIAVKKTGFKTWERKLKAAPGSNVRIAAELEKAQ